MSVKDKIASIESDMAPKDLAEIADTDWDIRHHYERNYEVSRSLTVNNTQKACAQNAKASRLQSDVDAYSSLILRLEDELKDLEASLATAREAKKEKDALKRKKRKQCDDLAQQRAKEELHINEMMELQNQSNIKTEELLLPRVRRSVLQEKLLSTDPHVTKTFAWIQHNKDFFKGEIYNPALAPMTLKDNRYADQVEAIIGPMNLTQFICEFEVDYKVLRTAIDTLEYRMHVIWTDFSTEYGYSKPSRKTPELKSYPNIDYFVSDLIDAPAFVINTLCLQSNIDNIPITLNPIADPSQTKLPCFAIGNDLYKRHTTSDNCHFGLSKMNILPAIYLQTGVCQRSIEDLQHEAKDLHVKLMKKTQSALSYSNSIKESDIIVNHEITNSKKRSSDDLDDEEEAGLSVQEIRKSIAAVKKDIKEKRTKLNAANKDLRKQNKEIDDLFTSGEYFNTLRDFIISAEEKIPGARYLPAVDWDEVFPKLE